MQNHLLRDLLTETGWTGQSLARHVNTLGVEMGLRLRYDRTSVAHWLSGTRPRHPVPELVAEVLSRELNRQITVAGTGLAPSRSTTPPHDQWWRTDVTEQLVRLCREGALSRRTVVGCVYSLASLSIPAWSDLVASPVPTRPDNGKTRIGRAEVDAASAMVELFSDADLAFGGGHGRQALTRYLHSTIVPWLRADVEPAVRVDLHAIAARLCYLCGFLYFDDELHGAAQGFYLAAVGLASDAGDAVGYAITLRALSVQARMLGHRRQAVDLAASAVAALPATSPTRIRAFLIGQVAVAHAAAEERRDAVTQLCAAEAYLERANETATPVGTYHPAALSHHHAAVRACLGERAAAMTALNHSIRRRPPTERRARAITLARLAELQLDAGELDGACGTWAQFLDDYRYLHSRRADTALATLRARLRPHTNYTVARAVHQKAVELHRARKSRP